MGNLNELPPEMRGVGHIKPRVKVIEDLMDAQLTNLQTTLALWKETGKFEPPAMTHEIHSAFASLMLYFIELIVTQGSPAEQAHNKRELLRALDAMRESIAPTKVM